MSKADLLRILTEAARLGNAEAIALAMWQLKQLKAPTSEVVGAIRLGSSRAALGL